MGKAEQWQGRKRCIVLGEYLAEHKSTVRQVAKTFGISKSTVHKDVTEILFRTDKALFVRVREVLNLNREERHLRGGEATRIKYSKRKAKQ